MAYLSLWVSIAAITAAMLFLKEGTLIVGEASKNFSELPSWMLRLASNPYTITALFFFILSALTNAIAMSRLKLSYITPLGYVETLVLTPIFALFLFEEKVTWLGWLGIVIICAGVFLVAMQRGTSDSKI